MNVTFVENAEHDVHGYECGENQQRLVGQGRLERGGGALESGLDAVGHPYLAARFFNRGYRAAERVARRNIERDRDRRKLALMVDDQRRRARLEMGEGTEWNFAAG